MAAGEGINTSDRAEGWVRFGDSAEGEGEEGVVDACVSVLGGDLKLQTASQVGILWSLRHQVEPGPLQALI